jgi:non-ribosomal peptide synthetase component E (peptide arylation enzyme)
VQRHLDALEVAKYKWPERLEWVSELPRSKVDKVDNKVLREIAATIAQTSGPPAPLSAD